MSTEAAAITNKVVTWGRSSGPGRFIRHFGEMLLAMSVGMIVLGGLAELGFVATGSNLTDASGAVQASIMGFNMTVPMVAWMKYRGHDWARNAEMAASMVIPTLAAVTLAVTSAAGATGALTLQHGVMIPAMLGVMLWRYDHYAHEHAHA
jgi:hypothetical protein